MRRGLMLAGLAAGAVACSGGGEGNTKSPPLPEIEGCPAVATPASDPDDDLVLLGEAVPPEAELENVVVDGRVAVTCDALHGMRVYDVCDPAQPVEAAWVERARCLSAALALPYVYVATTAKGTTGETSIMVFDLSDITNPVEVTDYRTTGVAYEGLHVVGDRLFAASHASGVEMFRIREDGTPISVSYFHDDLARRDAFSVAVAGERLFVADSTVGMRAFDLAAGDRPAPLGVLEGGGEERPEVIQGRSLATSGDVVYLAMAGDGVAIVDASGDAPRWIGRIATPRPAFDVDVAGDRLYVAAWSDLRVFDISDPRAPRLVATEAPAKQFPRVMGVRARDGRVYVAEWKSFQVYRHFEDRRPPDIRLSVDRKISFLDTAPGSADAVAVAVANDGQTDLKVDVSVAGSPAFSVGGDAAALIVPPGGEQAVELMFSPEEAGLAEGELIFAANDPDEAELRLPLVGNDPAATLGTDAPYFELPDLNGQPHTTRDYLGRVLVVVFVSTTCGACGLELPDVDHTVARAYGDRGVEVIAICGNSRESIQHFKRRVSYSFPTLLDTDPPNAVYSSYAALEPGIGGSVPLNFVIDRDGKVVYSSAGYSRDEVKAAVEEAAARQ